MKHIRILKDNYSHRYIVVILFEHQKDAETFYVLFNGRNFDPLPEVCNTYFVCGIEFISPKDILPGYMLELPSCPKCIEKLDSSVTGALTIVCNHSFHCVCPKRWLTNNKCLVCTLIYNPSKPPICSSCNIGENLWVCLVCGYIGCSRYTNKHSEEHYRDTKHTYSMELNTLRVWDYTRDGYVHRLEINQEDGKCIEGSIELRSKIIKNDFGMGKDTPVSELEMLMEVHLITQKRFFEEKMNHLETKLKSKLKFLESECAELLQQKLEIEATYKTLEGQKLKIEKKTKDTEKRLQEIINDTSNFKKLNETLQKAQAQKKQLIKDTEDKLAAHIKTQEEEKEQRIRELEEQIRDLKFYVEAQKGLAQQPDLKDGQVVKVPNPDVEKKIKKKGRKY